MTISARDRLVARDLILFIKPNNGSPPWIQHHRVWDADRFLESMKKQYTDHRDVAQRAVVEVIEGDGAEIVRKVDQLARKAKRVMGG